MSRCMLGAARCVQTPLLRCRRPVRGERTYHDLLELCRRRNFLLGERMSPASVLGGRHSLGPLGAHLKRNLINEWWDATVHQREQVLPIESPSHRHRAPDGWTQGENMAELRPDLLYGALHSYSSCLELLNRKLPFGIAEVGRCFQPITVEEDPDGCRAAERTALSLVWFSSAKTCAQWRDYWLRQRLLWWRKFAQVPSRFSSADHNDEEGRRTAVIQYDFPWGKEAIERLCTMDDSALTRVHQDSIAGLQGRDGRKSVIPHVVWVSSDVERGMLSYLSDALQVTENAASRGKEQLRAVLKLHPSLAPLKVAVDLGKGPAAELRLVCRGLCGELQGRNVSVWPGYLDTLQTPMEQLFTRYDEMGVLFTALVSDVTLESGLLQLRSRDTAIRETMHISKLGSFLAQHMTAATKL